MDKVHTDIIELKNKIELLLKILSDEPVNRYNLIRGHPRDTSA